MRDPVFRSRYFTPQQQQDELAELFTATIPSWRKIMVWQAGAGVSYNFGLWNFILSCVLPSGHPIQARCQATVAKNAAPVRYQRVLNGVSGLYEDRYEANPAFVIGALSAVVSVTVFASPQPGMNPLQGPRPYPEDGRSKGKHDVWYEFPATKNNLPWLPQ